MRFRTEIVGCFFRAIAALGAFSSFSFAQPPAAIASPNGIETILYNNPSDPADAMVTKSYADGMGRTFRAVIPDGVSDIIGGTVFDVFGRPKLTIKPYSGNHSHGWKNGADIKAEANSYYIGAPYRPYAGNRAYSENVYLDDPLMRVKTAGSPGYDFSVDRAFGAGAKRTWFFAVSGTGCLSNPTDAYLDAKQHDADGKFRLEVARDGSGKYAQIIKDLMGREIKKCSDPSATGTSDEIVTEYEYDHIGNPVKVKYPGVGGAVDVTMSATFLYSATGQRVSETHPDEGTIESVYDRSGRLRFTRDEKQRIPSDLMSFSYTKYDAIGRPSETGVVAMLSDEVATYFSESYADNRNWPNPEVANVRAHVRYWYDSNEGAAAFLDGDESYFLGSNLKGKLVGQGSCAQGFGSGTEVIIDSYSYDNEGRVAQNWKIIPGIPMQRYEFGFDIQGRLIRKSITKGAIGSQSSTSALTYEYDQMGRLKFMRRMQPNGSFNTLVSYSYSPTGEMVGKDFYKNGGDVAAVDYSYNIRGWTSTIDAYTATYAPLYNQLNLYSEAGGGSAPQYNGNISSMDIRYHLPGAITKRYSPFFLYDGANRLVAGYDLNGPSYSYEGFQYDTKGRLVIKMESGVQYGPYTYASGTNRVTQVGGHPTRNVANNFIYDPNGNMVFDRSKKMGIRYDWRNKPVLFRFYNSIPASVAWQDAPNLPGKRADVEMSYDASGSRVIKKTIRY